MKQQILLEKLLKFTNIFFICLVFLISIEFTSIAQNKKTWDDPPNSLAGKIKLPANESKVDRQFPISGTITGKFRHLWIVERIGELYWPKEPELKPTSEEWHGQIYEGGNPPEGEFELLLVDISEKTRNIFLQWFKENRRTGSYPGLTIDKLDTVIILDQKTYYLITDVMNK